MSDWLHRLIKQAKGQMERLIHLDSKSFELDCFAEVKIEAYSNTNTPICNKQAAQRRTILRWEQNS